MVAVAAGEPAAKPSAPDAGSGEAEAKPPCGATMTSLACVSPADQAVSSPATGSQKGRGIREGLAEVLPNCQPPETKKKRKEGKQEQDEVFYNPAQVFNRDLSIVMLSVFAKVRREELEERRKKREARAQETGGTARVGAEPGLKILEALAATGIRTIRYVKELGEGPEGVRKIVANDLDPAAVKHMRINLAHNSVTESKVEVTCADANVHMYTHRARGPGGMGDEAYDVIDLDPYGTCSPFLDAAVQSVADGGLLCITSTDMPVLGGNHPETCFARYGGAAPKASYVHEMSLRLVLHAVATAGAKYGREVSPLACFSIDFYVRLFVRVFDSPARVKRHASKTGCVHQCVQCESFWVQRYGEIAADEEKKDDSKKFRLARAVVPGGDCDECGGRVRIGGPMHTGPLYDMDFVQKALEACEEENRSRLPGVTSWKKVTGLLTAIAEEHPDLVLYFKLPQLCKGLKLTPVPLRQFRGTLKELGYRVSHFHREPEAVKTDAPVSVIYDLMRVWAEEHPPKQQQLPELIKKPVKLKRPVEWRTEEEVERGRKVARFLPNPEPNWGPKPRARGGGGGAEPAAAAEASGDRPSEAPPSGGTTSLSPAS
jgi:tRNA (guanine26-N2/guanine27-N2)-dimethyltransferase